MRLVKCISGINYDGAITKSQVGEATNPDIADKYFAEILLSFPSLAPGFQDLAILVKCYTLTP